MTTVLVTIQFSKKTFLVCELTFSFFGLYFKDIVKHEVILIMKLKLKIT